MSAAKRHPEGLPLMKIGAAMTPPPAFRNLQRWVSALVKRRKLIRIGETASVRYQWVDPDAVGPVIDAADAFPAATPVTQALQTLVGQPIVRRPPVGYHRDWLDAYRANASFYLSAEVRGALAASGRRTDGDGASTARIAADLAWRSGWLEGGTLTLPVVERLVAGQRVDCDIREAQLVRRQQAAWALLTSQPPRWSVDRDTLFALYATVAGHDVAAGPVEVRRQPLTFVASTYRPPADPILIESCLTQILATAALIADPIEQAFFCFVHLLSLQPFPNFNASVACLAVNLPLLRANLRPLTFAGVTGRDLLDAIVAVWELNRVELLAEVFARAYGDGNRR